MTILDADPPLVHRQAVRYAFIASACHGEPGIGETPTQRRVFLAVIHVPVNALAVDFLDVFAEEFGDVFIGRPVHRYAQLVAVLFLELGLQVRTLEPVGAEPVQVGELLVGQLIDLAVRRGGEGDADEVLDVQGRRGEVLALVGHQVGDRFGLAVAKVRTDQVRVVDPAVIDILVRLHHRLHFLDHVAFLQQVVGEFDPGDFAERLGQHFRLVLVGGQGLGNDLDVHAAKRLGRFDEPLQLFELLLGRQGRRFEFTADPFFRRVFVGIRPRGGAQTAECQHGCQ
ncbi:hypothetical protein D3C75_477720 [compost metagenome]